MSSLAYPRLASRPNALWTTLAAVCGGVYGAAWARYLFESQPQRFGAPATWPGVGLAVAAGALGVGLLYFFRLGGFSGASFAPMALLLPLLSLATPEVDRLRAQTLLAGALVLLVALSAPALLTPARPAPDRRNASPAHWGQLLPPAALFLLLFALYLRTLAPTVGEADTFEYQVAAARLGIAHGSGYPLLILLARLFAELPVGGTFAFRTNLAGAFSCGLAAVSVERLARRLGAGPLAAFLAGVAYGVSPILWVRAVGIETHPLNAFFLAALLYICIELIERPVSPRWLYALALLFGLGLTSHLTIILLAPACAVAVGWWLVAGFAARPAWPMQAVASGRVRLARQGPRFVAYCLRFLLPAGVWLLLGLSVFLYIPLRWPAVNQGAALSLEHFVYILKGGEAAGPFDPLLPFHDLSRWAPWLQKIVGEYTVAGFALTGVGALALVVRYPASATWQQRWGMALVTALMFAGHGYFALAYNTREPDWSDFFITVYIVTALLMGVGVQAVVDLGSRAAQVFRPLTALRRPEAEAWWPALALSAFAFIPLSSIWQTLPRVDQSQAWENYRQGQYTLRQPLAQGALVLADPVHLAPLFYLQVAEQVRPDLDIEIMPGEADYRARLEAGLAAGQTVYLERYLSGLGSAYSLRSVGPLAEVSVLPFTATVTIPQPLSATLGHSIHLLGSQSGAPQVAALESWPITLYWRTDTPADDNYLVSLRLVDAEGQVAWQSPERVPVNGLYPTNAWRPGETVSDFYQVPAAPTLAPGTYALEVGLFPPYHVSQASGWATVSPLAVLPARQPPTPAHALRMQLGPQWLMGYDLPESVAPGANFKVTLYWLRAAASDTVTAFGETRSLAAWPVGQLAPQTYRLTAPAAGGPFALALLPPGGLGQTAAVCGWLQPPGQSCGLPPVRLAGEALQETAVNYASQILLRKATLETASARPGDFVQVKLEWQALQSITEDYTVFVHLVGPDGRLYGQVDFWPAGGTQKTSEWKAGQVIEDPYRVQLSYAAPPGAYTVHVGFYLLATMERLPVLNAEGTPIDDHAFLTGLTVP